MSDISVVSKAQEETKSILANLQRGQILLETTAADFKPMMFAWNASKGIDTLKRLSETSSAFPVYPILSKDRVKKVSKKELAPFPLDESLGGKEWESENHANYHNIQKRSECDNVEKEVAGFKNHDHVTLPTQFAWERLNSGDVSDAAEASAGK
jgi:hypothetical protein